MLNQIGLILLEYAKVGILAFAILYVTMIIRIVYLLVKYDDVIQANEVVDDVSLNVKKAPWYIIAMKFIVWPWGIPRIAKDYIEFENDFKKQWTERHTC